MYMELARVQISSVFARVIKKKPIPKGIIGATVRLDYTDPAWKGLTKTVVFEGSGVTKDIPDAGEAVQIPAEVVTKLNSLVKVGVYGTDADNGIAIPTLWAELGYVRGAADPSGDEAADPELPIWAQLAERVEDLEKNPSGEVDPDAIKNAVEDYLEQNPVEAPVQSVNGKTGKVNLTAEHVNALPILGGTMTGPINMNGQILSGLNAPTEETQAANKGYVDGAVKKAAPHNLLDNSYFANPVNQRGQKSYKGAGYAIDRWECTSNNWMVTVEDGCLKVSDNPDSSSTSTAMLRQYIPVDASLRGKTVTLAAKLKGTDVRLNINNAGIGGYAGQDDWHIKIVTGVIPSDADTFFVALQSRNATEYMCEWIALYEGDYTAETLPEYQPKGYGTELAECQRYYQIVNQAYGNIRSAGTSAFLVLPLCVPMRRAGVSLASYSIVSVRANAKSFYTESVTGAQVFEYKKDASAVRLEVTGDFTGAENHIAYADGVFHLSAEEL